MSQECHLGDIQIKCLHLLNPGKNFAGRALHGDLTIIHDENMVGLNSFFHKVCDEDNGDIFFYVQ